MKKNIIIIGSRGYQYHYGGWETFVTHLIKNTKDADYQFYVPNLTHDKKMDLKIKRIDDVVCPSIYVKEQGFVTMFLFTIKATQFFLKYIQENHLENIIILMLGCKVGPLFPIWKRKLKRLHTKIIINPDGLEWKRDKWSWWIKKCFKISERYSIKYSDYCVCDSKSILSYVKEEYKKYHPRLSFIAFGAYPKSEPSKTQTVISLFSKFHIKENEYYLIVGRFIPENNYEVMIREFIASDTKKDLVIITNVEENKFYTSLEEKTHFLQDKRVKFIGTLYEEEALLYIRKHAFSYIHGHSVGGTNPSLLEALSITDVNILFDVCYNREVGEGSCLYFSKEEGSLRCVLQEVEGFDYKKRLSYGKLAKKRIQESYTWEIVRDCYLRVFDTLLEEE